MSRILKRRKEKALEKIADWEIALAIALAPYTERGEGARRVSENLERLRQRIKGEDPSVDRVVDIEFHRQLAELNRRRRARKEAGRDGSHDVAASVSP